MLPIEKKSKKLDQKKARDKLVLLRMKVNKFMLILLFSCPFATSTSYIVHVHCTTNQTDGTVTFSDSLTPLLVF